LVPLGLLGLAFQSDIEPFSTTSIVALNPTYEAQGFCGGLGGFEFVLEG
jgi:hypothetical protein